MTELVTPLKVAVVLPTLNEALSVTKVIDELLSIGVPARNIFVIDGLSTDNTINLVMDRYDNRIQIITTTKRGKGVAMRLGYFCVGLALRKKRIDPIDYVFTMDADFTYPAAAIKKALHHLDGSTAMVMKRVPLPGAMPFLNRMANWGMTLWANMVYKSDDSCDPIQDLCSGLWGFHWQRFDELIRPYLRSTGFTIESEYFCVLRKQGLSFRQFSYQYRPRIGGEKKTKPLDALRIMRYVFDHHRQEMNKELLLGSQGFSASVVEDMLEIGRKEFHDARLRSEQMAKEIT